MIFPHFEVNVYFAFSKQAAGDCHWTALFDNGDLLATFAGFLFLVSNKTQMKNPPFTYYKHILFVKCAVSAILISSKEAWARNLSRIPIEFL